MWKKIVNIVKYPFKVIGLILCGIGIVMIYLGEKLMR